VEADGDRSGLSSVARRTWLAISLGCLLSAVFCEDASAASKPERFITYTNVVDPKLPMSIHIISVDRSRRDLQFYTTLGGGEVFGMGNVTDQLKAVPSELGTPLAAINGDFYEKAKDYPCRPRDIMIRGGEVLTHPAAHTSFWIDPEGNPQMTNIYSKYRVVWPNGKETPFFMNVERTNDSVVLFTSALGPSTLTKGGSEYVLEGCPGREWLPLRAGGTYEAAVRRVLTEGNTPMNKETAVLSVGPDLLKDVPALKPGDSVRLVFETVPDLSGVDFAIGGGPALVQNGQVMNWKGWIHVPHPRTALGWNKDRIFLVVVDGRQLDVSLGMTFDDLAEFMLKWGCENALNFDGGGSTTLWAFGTVRNSPSEGQERPAPNALVIVRKNSRQAGK
jgi:hypothetical protein